MSLRFVGLILLAPLALFAPFAPSAPRLSEPPRMPEAKPDPDAVFADVEKDPARGKQLANAWRAFVDPRTGFAADSAVAADARRVLAAWAIKNKDGSDRPRLLALVARVEADATTPEARTAWARIALPVVGDAEATDEATHRDLIARLRKALPKGEEPAKFDSDNPGPLALGVGPTPKDAVKPPAAVVFLAWLAVRSYADRDTPNAAAQTVHDAVFPTLWATSQKLTPAQLLALVTRVDVLLAGADDRARYTWRLWSVPVALQVYRDNPALVGGADAAWKPHIARVTQWLRDKEIDVRFGLTPEGNPDQSDFLRPNDVLHQPKGGPVPGDHPLVLHLMIEHVKAALEGKSKGDPKAARAYLTWLAEERAVLHPDTAATVVGMLVRTFDPKLTWFDLAANDTAWKEKLDGDPKFVRDTFERVVAKFDGIDWSDRFGPAFLNNPVLSGAGESGLRAAGRLRLGQAWAKFGPAAAGRARKFRNADVPTSSLPEEVTKIGQGKPSDIQARYEKYGELAFLSQESARDAGDLDPVVRNPWCEPWLPTVPATRSALTLEEQARWRHWCRGVTPASVRFAARAIWPEHVSAAREANWGEERVLGAWVVLRELPWAKPGYRELHAELTSQALPPKDATWSDEVLTRFALVCLIGVKDDDNGKDVLTALATFAEKSGARACRLLAFAAAYTPRLPGTGVPLLVPYADRGALAQDVELAIPAKAEPKAFEFRATAEAVRALVETAGPQLDLLFSVGEGGLRVKLNAALRRTGAAIADDEGLRRRELALLVDIARLDGWSETTGRNLAERVGGADLGAAPQASVDAAVRLLGRVWDEDRRADFLSLAPPGRSRSADGLLKLTRRHVGALCVVLGGDPAALPDIPVLVRPGGYLPPAVRQPWWHLDGWRRLLYASRERRFDGSDFGDRHPEVVALLGRAADEERRWAKSPHDLARAAAGGAAEPHAPGALPERSFAAIRDEFAAAVKELDALSGQLEKKAAQDQLDAKLDEVRLAIQDNLAFDLAAAAERTAQAIADLRAAENRLEAAQHASLAAEAQLLASQLLADAAVLKAKQAKLEVEIRTNRAAQARLEAEKAKVNEDIAAKRITQAEHKAQIEKLDEEIKKVQLASIGEAIAVLEAEVKMVNAALFDPVKEVDPEDPRKKEVACAGQIGALAFKAELQVKKYIEQLEKTKGEYQERLKKLREGNCIKAVTRVIGSLCCLIPGAGPFIGMGIIAAGEIAAGIHTGKSFGEIAVSLIPVTLDIMKQAGFDAEKELNGMGAKLGNKLDGALKDIDSHVGPMLKLLPTFLDKNVLKVALDTAGLKGDAHKLFKKLDEVLGAAQADTAKLGKLGTILTTAGREAALAGATPEELFNNLKGKLKEEFERGELKKVLGELGADASLFGQKIEAIKNNPELLADRFAKLVIAKAAHGMAERRDRVLSHVAIGITALQAELRSQRKEFTNITELVTAQFAAAVEKLGVKPTEAELKLLTLRGKEFETALDELLKAHPPLKEKADEVTRLIEQTRTVLAVLSEIGEDAKALIKAEGGGYKPLEWKVLEPQIEQVLGQLLPEDRAGRALFAGRLRLHADPTYASDMMTAAVRPWQTALQQKLSKVEDKLNQPSAGDEEQQLEAAVRHVEQAQKELSGNVLGWLRQEDTPERRELRKRLTDLTAQLKKERANWEKGNLECQQADIRIQIAAIEEGIARKQAEVARMAGEVAAKEVVNADLELKKADLDKAIAKFEQGARKSVADAARQTFLQKRAELLAAEADVASKKHQFRARVVEEAFAERIKQERPDFFPKPDESRRALTARYDQKLEQTCALARELQHLLAWAGSPIDQPLALPHDRDGQVGTLRELLAAAKKKWSAQPFERRWIEIDLDGRTPTGAEHIRQLLSPAGVRLRVVPGPGAAGAVSLGVDGLVKEQWNDPSARIVAVVPLVGYIPDDSKKPEYVIPSQKDWKWKFSWGGSTFQTNGGPVEVVTPPNRNSLRDALVLPTAFKTYVPYNRLDRGTDWQLVASGGPEAVRLRRSGFRLPSPPTGVTAVPFTRVSDGPTQKPIPDADLDALVIGAFKVTQMSGLVDSEPYQKLLGPPLYGDHRVSASPSVDFENKPVHNVRLCVLYVAKK